MESKETFIEAAIFTAIMLIMTGAPFLIGIQVAMYFHWGCK